MKLFYSVPLSRLKAVFIASVKMTLILPDKCCPQLWDLNDYFPFLMKRGSCAKKQVGQKWGLSVVQISHIYCQEILSYFEFKAFDSAVLSLTGYFEGKGIHTKGKPLFRCLLDWLREMSMHLLHMCMLSKCLRQNVVVLSATVVLIEVPTFLIVESL